MAEITITEQNYEEEVAKSEIPVLLDFWASWCGPCKMMAPVVAQIAEKYEGKIKVGKVNVDDEPDLANRFRISAIPTLFVLKGGSVVNKAMGYRTVEQVEELIK